MKRAQSFCRLFFVGALFVSGMLSASDAESKKPGPDQALQILKDGNARFVEGKSTHPNSGIARRNLANKEDQGKYAFATVITCSDSRVPPEMIFDAGIMDIFVIRVAGNVCNTDEAGSIEYGLFHVNTPVLVVLGHSKCGAVTAVTQEAKGHGHKLETNIPALVAPIMPPVKRVIDENPGLEGSKLVDLCIEENVWQSFRDLFAKSPETRELVKSGKVKALGAIYDLETGKVNWLPPEKVLQILTPR